MTFGERVHALRLAKNMTLSDLSRLVGVSEATLNRYETGNIKNPKQERVSALAQALGVTEVALMGWDEEQLDVDVRLLAHDLQQLPPEKRKKAVSILQMLIND